MIATNMSRITPRHSLSEAELLGACRRGDQCAWDEIVQRYGGLVHAAALRLRLSSADADDVSQSVFSILHQKLATIRDAERLTGWLVTTARRESLRVLRSRRRHQSIAGDHGLVASTSLPEEAAGALERQHLVRQALRRLAPRDEQLLSALFLDQNSADYGDVAQRLDMPVGSIGPTRARAFARLARLLEEKGAGQRPTFRNHAGAAAQLHRLRRAG